MKRIEISIINEEESIFITNNIGVRAKIFIDSNKKISINSSDIFKLFFYNNQSTNEIIHTTNINFNDLNTFNLSNEVILSNDFKEVLKKVILDDKEITSLTHKENIAESLSNDIQEILVGCIDSIPKDDEINKSS